MIHGLSNDFLYAAYRLDCTFGDGSGQTITCQGTGFWVINSNGQICLVTNRHVLDVSYAEPNLTGFELKRLIAAGKGKEAATGLPNLDVRFEIVSPDVKFSGTEENDVACVINPGVVNLNGNGSPTVSFNLEHRLIAARTDLESDISICDFVAFPGFHKWHDERQRRPILRTGTVSSDPRYDYSWNDAYQGECIAYEAFSYGGSSGSPVFAVQKGPRPGEGISFPGFREIKMTGINAGHLSDDDQTHSGISYMYKSSVILDIIDT